MRGKFSRQFNGGLDRILFGDATNCNGSIDDGPIVVRVKTSIHMIALRRRRKIWTVSRIVLFTLLALLVQWAGSLTRIENDLDDLRIRYCQYHIPKPTDRLVHLDIDENALEQIGRWPWDRDELADVLEEVRA